MSYSSMSMEEIHSLQQKLDNEVINCGDVSDVLAISEEIDHLLKVNK